MIKELKKQALTSVNYPSGEIITKNYFDANSNIYEYRYINTDLDESQELNIVFTLPVKENKGYQFGDPLTIIKDDFIITNELKNNVIFITPVFSTVPWYANHPTNITIQQERDTYNFIDFIKSQFNVFSSIKTSVLSFSKGGWGAISLEMNRSGNFDNIFIWDSPLGIEDLTFGLEMTPVFDTDANFDTYDLKTRLPTQNTALELSNIYIGGYELFQTESESFTDLLPSYPNINYQIDGTLNTPHEWRALWMEALLKKVNDFFL